MNEVSPGHLLIEACIGLVIVTLFSTLITQWHTHLCDTQRQCSVTLRALCLAQSIAEHLRAGKNYPSTFSTEYFQVQLCKQQLDKIIPYSSVTIIVQRGQQTIVILKTGRCHE